MAAHAATPQIEADKRLLKFETYEDYLDSLVTPSDLCYLQSTISARHIAELGYRSSGETLSREDFTRRLAAVIAYLYPSFKPYELTSEGLHPIDEIHKQLAIRERPNRIGILATIIFVRHFTKTGFEVSGYVDFAERLKNEDWKPFFKGKARLWPRPQDLGYYHWRVGNTTCNDSENYKVMIDPVKGLLFQNRFDRKIICVDPAAPPGNNTTRMRVNTELYEHVVVYDHVVRRRN